MSDFRADLHCHTVCSDGSFTVGEVIEKAQEKGLKGLSITDHDTVDAYQDAQIFSEKFGIKLLSGIEFSTIHKQASVHVLAYAFDVSDKNITALCYNQQRLRQERIEKILEKLRLYGFVLDIDDLLKKNGAVGRPHIAQQMVQKGYVQSVKEAFRLYLGDNKPCFEPSDSISTEDALATIHKANAFAIIAHPHLIKDQFLLSDLLKMDFDGLEAYYANFLPDKEKVWVKIASQRNWLITGGSDFHGPIKPENSLGSSWVNEETFYKLYERFSHNLSS